MIWGIQAVGLEATVSTFADGCRETAMLRPLIKSAPSFLPSRLLPFLPPVLLIWEMNRHIPWPGKEQCGSGMEELLDLGAGGPGARSEPRAGCPPAALQGFRLSAGGGSRMPEGRFRVTENESVLLLWRK